MPKDYHGPEDMGKHARHIAKVHRPMPTYGSPTDCQGCDQTRLCDPYIVTWDQIEYLEGRLDTEAQIERVYYCPDCYLDITCVGLDHAESVILEWKAAAIELIEHATAIVLRLDLADIEKASPMCSAIREPLRHAIIAMRRVLED